MNVAWWNFLMYISVQHVLPIILQAAPETVSLVLGGGPLTRKELLLLPAKWKGVFLCTICLDMVTGKAVQNGDLMEAYIGSATGQKGLDGRFSCYWSVNNGDRKSDGNTHENLICEEDAKANLRVLAVSDSTIPKPYVMLSELLHTILVQSLVLGYHSTTNSSNHNLRGRTASCSM